MATINGTNNNDQGPLKGTSDDDIINGLDGKDFIEGLEGADQIDGGDGIDRADYTSSNVGVNVNLLTNVNTGGHAAGDVLTNIESLIGSAFSDTLTGDAGDNHISGEDGDDVLEGGAGADLIDGGNFADSDTASYASSDAGVTVNLGSFAKGIGGHAEGDEIYNTENLLGSSFADKLTGNFAANTLTGGGGDDILGGGAGNDSLNGGAGNDTAVFSGNFGDATITKNGSSINVVSVDGTDSLSEIEFLQFSGQTVSVESLFPSSATIQVTTFLDVVDANDGVISLREAVTAANGDGSKTTIELGAGLYDLTLHGELDITGDVVIKGAGHAQTTLRNPSLERIFHTHKDSTFVVDGITLDGATTLPPGQYVVDGITIIGDRTNKIVTQGGALLNEGGDVSIVNAVFKDFTLHPTTIVSTYTGKGASESYTPSEGGAIFNATGSVEIVDSFFSGNIATFGGALAMRGGYVSVDATAFDNNKVYESVTTGVIYEKARPGIGSGVYSDGAGAAIYSRSFYDIDSETRYIAKADIFSNKAGTGVATTITNHNLTNTFQTSFHSSDGPISLIDGNSVYLDPAIVITGNTVQFLSGVNRIAPHVSAALAPSPSQSNDAQSRLLGDSALLTLAKGLNLSLDNPDLALVANSILSQSESQIVVQLAGNRLVLTGTGLSFTGDPIALTAAEQILAAAGTITGITIQSKDGSTTVGTLTGISSSFKDVVTDLTNASSNNALADVFGATISQNGSTEVDTLVGSKNADVINALASDDTITGKGGNDTIDGGSGVDTAKYAGDAKTFTVTFNKGAATTITDRSGTEGTDSLTNVEKVDFATGNDVSLDILNSVVNVSSADLSAFIEMYIAYFNRAPDAEGLFYWGTRLSQGMSKNEIAESFYVQPETQALYTNPADTKGFVTAVYSNFLGRAPDTDGFNYWVKQLDDGIVSKPIFLLAIINGAKAASGSQTDVDYFTNKANIGVYYSVIKGMSNTANGKAAMALYDGTAASVTAAKNAIDGYYAAAVDANTGELLINLVGVMDDPFAV